MRHICLFVFICIICIISCTKPDTKKLPPVITDSSTNLQDVVNTDSAKFILVSNFESDNSGTNDGNLICFNPDKSIRWERKNLGSAPSSVFYADNKIYFVTAIKQTNDSFIYNLYAINGNNGDNIWKISISDGISEFLVRNDTIFCSYHIHSTNTNTIAALNANNGTIYWRQPISDHFGPLYFKLDGNILYFISSASIYDTKIKANAFNITSRAIKWTISDGYAVGGSYSGMAIGQQMLYIGNGSLHAFDKNTGTLVWSKNDLNYQNPIVLNDSLYILGSESSQYYMCRINPLTGETLFQTNTHFFSILNSQPFVSDNYVYAYGYIIDNLAKTDTSCVVSFSASNGTQRWKAVSPYPNTGPIVAGNKVYTFRSKSLSINYREAAIIVTDCNTGKIVDSLGVSGSNPSVCGIVTYSGKFLRAN